MCPVSVAEKPSLLTRYENLRRKEFEQLTGLLDTLGKVDGLPEDQMEQARDALFHTDHPYLIVLVGAFNTGKSSLINALIGEPVLGVGATPTTTKIAILRHGPAAQRMNAGQVDTIFHPSPLLERVSLVDTPGLDSVFKGHDEITRRFLHRADIVLLVMMATQAMSASNVNYLQSLRDYGKRIIVVVNQIDLLEPEEQATIRDFVAEQGKTQLGITPEVWMLSARRALEAYKTTPRDEALWTESGFAQVETFINKVLSDSERVRQKLETPLQIVRNVMGAAMVQVRQQQDSLAEYRRSAENVKGQIDASLREQETTVRTILEEIDKTFAESIRRGREAIHEVFQWSKALSLALSGLLELIGLARFFRRFGRQTLAQGAFAQYKVDEPLAQIPAIADRVGPRLEGRDVKDVDDLILYTRHEIERLPGAFQRKIIGNLQPPSAYDRAIMANIQDNLVVTLEKARTNEFRTIDKAVRNTIVQLGVYEVIVLLGGLLMMVALAASGKESGLVALLMVIILGLALGGLALVPLRGAVMENAHANRVRTVKTEYATILAKAAALQVGYGRQMRQDAVAPFMRMVQAQVAQADQVKGELAAHEQKLTVLESELGDLRENKAV
jgi:small GTP-binding protein